MKKYETMLILILSLSLLIRFYPQHVEQNNLSETDSWGHYLASKSLLYEKIPLGWASGYLAFPGFAYLNTISSVITNISLVKTVWLISHLLASLTIITGYFFGRILYKDKNISILFILLLSFSGVLLERQIRTIPEAIAWTIGFITLGLIIRILEKNRFKDKFLFLILFFSLTMIHHLTAFFIFIATLSLYAANILMNKRTNTKFIILTLFLYGMVWLPNKIGDPVLSNILHFWNDYTWIALVSILILGAFFSSKKVQRVSADTNSIIFLRLHEILTKIIENRDKKTKTIMIIITLLITLATLNILFGIWSTRSYSQPNTIVFYIYGSTSIILAIIGFMGIILEKNYRLYTKLFCLMIAYSALILASLSPVLELLPFNRVVSVYTIILLALMSYSIKYPKYQQIILIAIIIQALSGLIFGYGWIGRGVPEDAYFTTNQHISALMWTKTNNIPQEMLILDGKLASIYGYLFDAPITISSDRLKPGKCIVIPDYYYKIGPISKISSDDYNRNTINKIDLIYNNGAVKTACDY